MKHLLHICLWIVLCCTAATVFAQTTYTLPSPVTCQAASALPVTYFGQFSCTGVFYDSGQIEVYFNAGAPAFEIWTPQFTVTEYESSMKLTQFTQPVGSMPGIAAFNWSGYDQGGVLHTGSWSGTWINDKICSNRCWYHPKIETSTLTIRE